MQECPQQEAVPVLDGGRCPLGHGVVLRWSGHQASRSRERLQQVDVDCVPVKRISLRTASHGFPLGDESDEQSHAVHGLEQ